MSWLDRFKRKKVNCKLCDNVEYKHNMFIFEINTLEGLHKIQICQECANTLNEMKGKS